MAARPWIECHDGFDHSDPTNQMRRRAKDPAVYGNHPPEHENQWRATLPLVQQAVL